MESIIDDRDLKDFLEEAELDQYHELFRNILKVTKISQLKFVASEDLSQIGLSNPEQRRYKKIYAKYFPNPYIHKLKKLLSSNKKQDVFTQSGPFSITIDYQHVTDANVKVPTKHIISIEDITINKELGTGQFGVVQQGIWNTGSQRLQVAIKCLGHERMTSNSTEFLKEAAVMHSIEHANIVRLYGVVLHLDSLMLVTELAPLRSLLECLHEVGLRPSFPVLTLCEFAEQICDGMTYLEQKRLIHRDLAARNILVFSRNLVKISDFGLSRALGVGKDYYQTNYNVNLKLPVAWCAPECILYLKFTSASDVWAFGVCMWEMFTYGFQPWIALTGQQILEAIDAPKYQRLECPECCPEEYYSAMLKCWSHEPSDRPKFKDLAPKLREIRPEQVQAVCTFKKPEDGRRSSLLGYKSGQIITVLGKENMTNSSLWYGFLLGGTCGLFDPSQTKPFSKDKTVLSLPSISPKSARSSIRSIRSSLLRSDVKRHTYTGKRMIDRGMISSPQGEVKHTGHVGLDGAYFGDIAFLDPADYPPRQVVTPYKPSEDLEQQPLINPNSPSHLSAASCTPSYPLLSPHSMERTGCDEVDLSCPKSKGKNAKKHHHKSVVEPTTSKSLLNKVKYATLGRAHKSDSSTGAIPKTDENHEYHEISDTDTDTTTTDPQFDNFILPDSPGIPKTTDFSQSLIDEMEYMFRTLENSSSGRACDIETVLRTHTLSKLEKKKNLQTGTMKPMSAHDEKTLDTAVAMANELTTKSMNDLDSDVKVPQSLSEKSKFHFKFPLVSLHLAMLDPERDFAGKPQRRNFSEEAKGVLDIQESISEEGKMAYTSLIEQPTPAPTLISQITKDATEMEETFYEEYQIHSMYYLPFNMKTLAHLKKKKNENLPDEVINVLPLPPRNSKTKLVDQPRHTRKYPLILPPTEPPPVPPLVPPPVPPPVPPAVPPPVSPPVPPTNGTAPTDRPIIYQNTTKCPIKRKPQPNGDNHKSTIEREKNTVDVFDGPEPKDTNPFISTAGANSVNPFNYYLETVDDDDDEVSNRNAAKKFAKERTLVKDCTDHVSVEDLLEFADQKPCGRQRGVESDEVRIMNKVLKQQVTPEDCLEALELSDWNVHTAIKMMRVKISVGPDVQLEDCLKELNNTNGDVLKAAAVLVLYKKNTE